MASRLHVEVLEVIIIRAGNHFKGVLGGKKSLTAIPGMVRAKSGQNVFGSGTEKKSYDL